MLSGLSGDIQNMILQQSTSSSAWNPAKLQTPVPVKFEF